MCFRPELTLGRGGSAVLLGIFDADTLRVNHFEGFVKNWVNPEEGDVDRGEPEKTGDVDPEGANVSCGLKVLEA